MYYGRKNRRSSYTCNYKKLIFNFFYLFYSKNLFYKSIIDEK